MHVMRAFVIVVERKGCHCEETEMMPRQHSDDPVAHGDTGAKGSGCECVMQEDGVIPVTGFPRVDGVATKRNNYRSRADTTSKHASHTTHAFVHGRSFSTVIPL